MLGFAELHSIARTVAAQSGRAALFDDIVQEAWLRFLQWPPRHRQGAWLMATQAKNEAIYRDRQDVSAGMLYPTEIARIGALERIWDGRQSRRWWWLVWYALSDGHSGRDRSRAHRYRVELAHGGKVN